jgi:hypothetical protein
VVIVRDGWYLEEEMDVEKLILLVKDHEAIYVASSPTKYNGILTCLYLEYFSLEEHLSYQN